MRKPERHIRMLLAGLLLAGGLVACSSRPDPVMSDGETAELLADLHIADAYGTLERDGSMGILASDEDSLRKVLRQSVLKSHGVSEEQLDTTLGWYGHNLDKYEEMYEKVLEKIDKKKIALTQARAEKDASPTLWPYGNMQRVPAVPEGEGTLIPFDIPADKVSKGARILWEGKTLNVRGPIDFFMAVDYTDGSTGYIQRNLMGEGRQNVALQTDTASKIKRAYGYLRVRLSEPLLIDSISLRTAPFNETSYYEIHSARRWTPK